MSRYIDADKLMMHLNDYKLQVSPSWKDDWEKMVSCLVIDTCMEAVKEQPTADVVPMDYHERCLSVEIQKRMNMVEVVRCKDCKHRTYDGSRDLYYCNMYYGMGNVSDDNYCSFGERADE